MEFRTAEDKRLYQALERLEAASDRTVTPAELFLDTGIPSTSGWAALQRLEKVGYVVGVPLPNHGYSYRTARSEVAPQRVVHAEEPPQAAVVVNAQVANIHTGSGDHYVQVNRPTGWGRGDVAANAVGPGATVTAGNAEPSPDAALEQASWRSTIASKWLAAATLAVTVLVPPSSATGSGPARTPRVLQPRPKPPHPGDAAKRAEDAADGTDPNDPMCEGDKWTVPGAEADMPAAPDGSLARLQARYSPACDMIWPRLVHDTDEAHGGTIHFVVVRAQREYHVERPNDGRYVVGVGIRLPADGCVYITAYIEYTSPFDVSERTHLGCVTRDVAVAGPTQPPSPNPSAPLRSAA